MYDKHKVHWTMTVTIYHGPNAHHAVELATERMGSPRLYTHDSLGGWSGSSPDPEQMEQMETLLLTAFQEHMYNTYGVQDAITGWRAEPDPF